MTSVTHPKVSFGMPILNGAEHVEATIKSVLDQDYPNLELVISDNGSTDGTIAIIERYTANDARVRLHKHPKNIGQNPNFNFVLSLAKGKYFRWIGMDDWVEPSYASRCVEMMEADPDAIGVTTNQMYIDDDGNEFYAEFNGDRLDSPRIQHRFKRMMWFMSADYRFIDPIYTLYRRDVMDASPKLRVVPTPDKVLSVDLALMGRMLHVRDCLCGRRRVPAHYNLDHAEEYLPGHSAIVRGNAYQFSKAVFESSLSHKMSALGRAVCFEAVVQYAAKKFAVDAHRSLRRTIRPHVKALLGKMKPESSKAQPVASDPNGPFRG